ncbi:holin [Mycobacterium phage Stasia]|uniref:Holin n=1 Tax=Mycobacterium phage Stasia TaxID=1897548 RepID=A0A1D8EUK7_9CAUD|nr:holin [Mycobacterium phage Stasia]AOT24666.1 holin [Mycobacterium phage Stasia]
MSPKLRETLYYLGTIVPGVLGIALIWGGIDAGAANSIGDILAGAFALLGASAPAVAAKKVHEQRKDGTLEPQAPVDQIVNSVQAVLEAQAKATAEVERVKQVVTGAINVIPGLGPLASQAINAIPTDLGQAVQAVNSFPTQMAYSQQFSDYRAPWDR